MLWLVILLVLLILLSGFFSSSETGMMALNRYRLRHQARKGNRRAMRIVELLARTDRLLGVILLGNTFANILASAVATIIAIHYFGDVGIALVTIFLTIIILIFAETAPKTYAALNPEKLAFKAAWPLKLLLRIFYPLVWLVNSIANGMLRLFGVKVKHGQTESLSVEELKFLVHETGHKMQADYQQMLLRLLDLSQITVEDAMVPKAEIEGLDLSADMVSISAQILKSEHAVLPVYQDHIDQVKGMLKLRRILPILQQQTITSQDLLHLADKVYFVPEGASLNQQLLNFRDQHQSVGLVVDEYGDIQGLVTLQDVLAQIVGEFAIGESEAHLVQQQKDGSVRIDASINVRDLNRARGWRLPTGGPKTLSGLIIEHLELIPKPPLCCVIADYKLEIISVADNTIDIVKVLPPIPVQPDESN